MVMRNWGVAHASCPVWWVRAHPAHPPISGCKIGHLGSDSSGWKGQTTFFLGTAPSTAPQNLHAIRTDSSLILEWEEVILKGPSEAPLGPYKLFWVQDNGTQVREPNSAKRLGFSLPLECTPPPPVPPPGIIFQIALGLCPMAVLSEKQEVHSCTLWGRGKAIPSPPPPAPSGTRVLFVSGRILLEVMTLRRLYSYSPRAPRCLKADLHSVSPGVGTFPGHRRSLPWREPGSI